MDQFQLPNKPCRQFRIQGMQQLSRPLLQIMRARNNQVLEAPSLVHTHLQSQQRLQSDHCRRQISYEIYRHQLIQLRDLHPHPFVKIAIAQLI